MPTPGSADAFLDEPTRPSADDFLDKPSADDFLSAASPRTDTVASRARLRLAGGMGAEKAGRTVAPGIMEEAAAGSPTMTGLQQAGERGLGAVTNTVRGIGRVARRIYRDPSMLTDPRRLVDAAQQEIPEPVSSAIDVVGAGFKPLTAPVGAVIRGGAQMVGASPETAQAAGDVAEMASLIPMAKIAPEMFGLHEPAAKAERPTTGLYHPSAEMEETATATKPLSLVQSEATPAFRSPVNAERLRTQLAEIDQRAAGRNVHAPAPEPQTAPPTIYGPAGQSLRREALDEQLAGIDRRMKPQAPPRRVFNVEPSNETEMGRVRYAERGPAGLLPRAPASIEDLRPAEPPAQLEPSPRPAAVAPEEMPEPLAARAEAPSAEDFLDRPTTLQPTRVELSSLKSAARDRGYADPQDVPEILERKIAARRNLEALADSVDALPAGTVGRYRTERGGGQGFDWVGVKSALPKQLQQGFSYADVSDIIRGGLAGEKLSPRRARFFQDLQDYALKKDGPIGEQDLQAFLGDHDLALDTRTDIANRAAEAEKSTEREAIQTEKGDTSFPPGEPITELSPEASRRQAAVEESDAAARQRQADEQQRAQTEFEARPKGPTEQPGLFGRTDRGRPLDQRDLDFERAHAAIEYEAGKNPLELGSRVSYKTASSGPAQAERFYDRSLASQNRGVFGSRGPFAKGGLHSTHQLSDAAPEVAQAWRRAEGSGDLARLTVQNVASMVEDAGGKGAWEKFKAAMVDDNLRGMEKGYRGLAAKIRGMTPEEVVEEYGGTPYGISGRLGAISETKVFSGMKLAEKADRLYEQGRGGELKALLSGAFDKAADNTGRPKGWSPQEIAQTRNAPWFQQAHDLYRENFGKPFEEAHTRNEGVPLQFPGDLGYYPLIGKGEQKLGFASRFGRPRNFGNAYRTGLSSEYDLSTQGLLDQATRAYKSNNLASAMKATEDASLLKYEGVKRASQNFDWNGRTFSAGRLEKYQGAVVPEWLKDEVDPIIKKQRSGTFDRVWNPTTGKFEMTPATTLGKAAAWTTKTYLLGPSEGIGHAINVAGAAIAKIPNLGTSLAGRAMSSILTRTPATILKVLTEKVTGPEVQATLREMAENGEMHPRQGSVTWSKEYAKLTGAEWKPLSLSPTLYGPHSFDLKARVLARRLLLEQEPNASAQKLWEYSNHFGQYHQGLVDTMTRTLKRSGLAPFATASSTMTKNALETITGTGTLPGGKGTRLWNVINGSVWGVTAAYIAASKAYTGKYPWNDPKMKLFQIPLNDDDRRSDWAVKLWGPPSKGTAYINFGRLLNPMAERAGRASGIRGVVETLGRGGTAGQAGEAGLKDVANTMISLIAGPAVRVATRLALGVDPRIMSVRESGKPGVVLQPATRERTAPGIPTLKARLDSLPGAFNPLIERGTQAREKGTPLRGFADTFLPNVLTGPSNVGKQKFFLKKELAESRRPTRAQ